MADLYLTKLTSQKTWQRAIIIRGEAKAQESGFRDCEKFMNVLDGPKGAKSATLLPMSPVKNPSERSDSLATANVQRLRALDPVSAAYAHYEDELVKDKEEWDSAEETGLVNQWVDECWEAVWGGVMTRLVLTLDNPDSTTYAPIRGADNTLEALAADAHSTLISGTTEDNLANLALSGPNVKTVLTDFAKQIDIVGRPLRGGARAKYIVGNDLSVLYEVTESLVGSSGQEANIGRTLQPIVIPDLTRTWFVVSGRGRTASPGSGRSVAGRTSRGPSRTSTTG
ncbi:MAG: hypothetical protein M5U09_13745 [Gammaproteobacteria bacterium]|nr:hypothetical protein [Gammaproteobacteria bacterium]